MSLASSLTKADISLLGSEASDELSPGLSMHGSEYTQRYGSLFGSEASDGSSPGIGMVHGWELAQYYGHRIP